MATLQREWSLKPSAKAMNSFLFYFFIRKRSEEGMTSIANLFGRDIRVPISLENIRFRRLIHFPLYLSGIGKYVILVSPKYPLNQ